MKSRTYQPEKVTDARKPVDADAREYYAGGVGLVAPLPLSAFKTFSDWQRAIRATVDLATLEMLYSQLGGPELNAVAKKSIRTEEKDRGWTQAWLYYEGTLRHVRQYAQTTHWTQYAESWDEFLKRFGGDEPIAAKLAQLDYDKPKWVAKKKEIEVATKEKRNVVKAEKAAAKAEKENKPMGFRAGTPQAKIAEHLIRYGKMGYDKVTETYKYPSDFIAAANKRGHKVQLDKANGVVTYSA